jgi:hypothetical protein
MVRLFRRRLPGRLRPRVARDERIVAWACTSDGAALVATNLGLWLPGRSDRLGWQQIHKASWEQPVLRVVPAQRLGDGDGYEIVADGPDVSYILAEPAALPAVVRQRVTRSVAYTRHDSLPGGGARVVARRTPGRNGVTWHVRYDDGTDPDDPAVVQATQELVTTIVDAATPHPAAD